MSEDQNSNETTSLHNEHNVSSSLTTSGNFTTCASTGASRFVSSDSSHEVNNDRKKDDEWDYYFTQVSMYYKTKHNESSSNSNSNHCNNTPQAQRQQQPTEMNPKLKSWISNQRKYSQLWEAGLPSPFTSTKISKLKSISFFELSTKWDEVWDDHYHELKEFYELYGHLNVESYIRDLLKNHEDENDQEETTMKKIKTLKKLSQWIIHQRHEYIKYESQSSSSITTPDTDSNANSTTSTMTPYRIRKLDSLGFIWDTSKHAFDIKVKQLQEFKNIHGHLNIPKNHPLLGRWVARQRELYRKRRNDNGDNDDEITNNNSLTEERIQQLENIGLEWISNLKGSACNKSWEKHYQNLSLYKENHGHCNVPKNWKDNKELGSWVRNQRAQYWSMKISKKGPMTRKRVLALEHIGFQWKLR